MFTGGIDSMVHSYDIQNMKENSVNRGGLDA